jgi:hypothetical protein
MRRWQKNAGRNVVPGEGVFASASDGNRGGVVSANFAH